MLRIENSDLQVESEINKQYELIDNIKAAPERLPVAIEAVEIVSAILSRQNGIDTDEDGLFDSVETDISVYSESVADVLGTAVLNLNPDEEESTPGNGLLISKILQIQLLMEIMTKQQEQ